MPREIAVPGAAGSPLSNVVRAGDLLFVAGQTAYDPQTGVISPKGIEAETRAVLEQIKSLLEQAGASLDDVVKCNVYLADSSDAPHMTKVYREFFPNNPPARTTVGVSFPVDIRVEIEAIAYAPKK